ncbi:autotransporter outer membrane beta-barrel domain-containing protein [Pseudomonas granadensis]|uniref:autotransporter outer membrane beta-barrel domain-containing protein n=1 Tax=Pseudomonas granadensis TaxID=1421430 RepID=UPI00087B5405|nr:autotransporter outer membrane beta-barrel domain-containing protein [Pseudomonas granadensis]SDT63416.1 outer membrane autotransporter barrel domain-containing protein [Pseudomonas granadensis]
MRTQHGCKPEHLALAISLALGCVEFANAEQPPEAAEPFANIAAPQPTEASAKEKAAERLQSFLSDPGTVPIVFETAQKTFKGTAVNDLISLKDGASFTGRLDGGEGDNVLFLDATEGGVLKDTRNFNGLVVAKGDWTSNSRGDFKEGVLVQGGTALTSLGSIKGDVYVDNGGSFAGKGTVANLQVGGLLTVNGALGAPRVKGDLRLAPTAELAYEVTPSGSQTIKVDGTAALAGATLNIVAAQGEYPQSSQYKVIEAGAVEGEFGTIRNNLAFMTATPQYHKKSVGLTYARNDVALEEVATTDAGRAVAESIDELAAPLLSSTPTQTPDSISTSTSTSTSTASIAPEQASIAASALASMPIAESLPVAINEETVTAQAEQAADQPAAVLTKPANTAVAALLSSDKTTAPIALEQLAAGSNANLAKATLSSITPVSASMLSAMQQLSNNSDGTYTSANSPRQASAAADTGRVWIQALGHGGKVDRDVDSTLKHATHGLVLGTDWRLDEQWHVGLLGGKSQTRLDARRYDGDLDSWHLGAYAVRQDGPMALRLGATWASHEGSSKRRVAFNGFSDRLQGNYNANTQQAFAELGYNFGRHNATLEPFASLGYQRYQRDSYREKGGDAALEVFEQTRGNLSSTFGLRAAHTTRLDNGMRLTPRFSAGWKHTFGEIDNHTHQQLIEGGKRFEVAGAALDRNSLSIDTGLDLGLSANHTVGFGLTAEAGNDSRTHGVMGQWRMAF